MRPALNRSAILLLPLTLASCASGPTVTLRVVSAQVGDARPVPVAGAFVHAAPIGMSEVPLPVSLETLSESASPGASGVTDENGEITLRLSIDRPHDLAVTAPFTENRPDRRETWRGRLSTDSPAGPVIEPILPASGLTVTLPGKPR